MNWIQPIADTFGWDYYPTLIAFIATAVFILFVLYQCVKCICAGPICLCNTINCLFIRPLRYCLLAPCMDSIFGRRTVSASNMKYKPVNVDEYI